MTWRTPTLSELRGQARDAVSAKLKVGALVRNSRARILADATAGLARLCLQYVDWLADQIFPDLAEEEWLRERHARIWLGGAKAATYAAGGVIVRGVTGALVPSGARLVFGSGALAVQYEVTASAYIEGDGTIVPAVCLTPGAAGNLDAGTELSFASTPDGIEATVAVDTMAGGADVEETEALRARILQRIRNTPMGGAAADFERWALEVAGVTRAWCAPLEMGIGTVTVRVMFDALRADRAGIATSVDLDIVRTYVDKVRPVAVKDVFVETPILFPVSFNISNLAPDTAATRAAIAASVSAMIADRAAPARQENGVLVPAQVIYREWISAAILSAPGVESFRLDMSDAVPPAPGYLATLGTIGYA